ncbi:MAG: TPM domain-containing protein [Flavobacteriales bacterium]|nr:TPM domain-containing protein [Flavobacteriales bacterium]
MMRALFACTFLLATKTALASEPCIPAVPERSEQIKLVWEFTDLLNEDEEQRLNTKLTRFAQRTSNRILVLVVDTLCGLPPSDFAFQIGEEWGIGAKGSDNGVVVLIKPTGPPGQRHVFIATGYGLEGVIPDLTAKRIVDKEIIPWFKQGEYFKGLDAGTDVIMSLAKGEFDHASYDRKKVPWILIMFFVGLVLFIIWAWRKSVERYARVNDIDFWTAWWLMSQANRRHTGHWGGFIGRGGSSGGGGFGGFGGGSFGGGGAGGSW